MVHFTYKMNAKKFFLSTRRRKAEGVSSLCKVRKGARFQKLPDGARLGKFR